MRITVASLLLQARDALWHTMRPAINIRTIALRAALSALSALRHARIRVESTVDDTETRAGQRTSCCHSIGSAWHVHIGWRHLGPSTLQRAHSAVHSIVANAAYCQERQFDRLSKTNTVETLLSNLDADALQKCAQFDSSR
jgi:hypothetical protein